MVEQLPKSERLGYHLLVSPALRSRGAWKPVIQVSLLITHELTRFTRELCDLGELGDLDHEVSMSLLFGRHDFVAPHLVLRVDVVDVIRMISSQGLFSEWVDVHLPVKIALLLPRRRVAAEGGITERGPKGIFSIAPVSIYGFYGWCPGKDTPGVA